ncbi:MAG: VWA domain-containing protein [Candidatus Thiodiazotropha sp.]
MAKTLSREWLVWCVSFLILLLCLGLPVASAWADVDEMADVRILIDVSGSMKKNDPENLRRPALRLLVGLLPPDTRAGVWTFGQYVNMQIPLGQVDKAWKAKARKSSESIGSPGQFTNIEDALKRATEDWSGPPGPYRRSVILLTDGMVDISKDRARNAASKKRIIQGILPGLKQQGVTIHTIALSKNADHELMRQLADTTGGWYEMTESADALQKLFLRLFEKVGKPDAIPLKDNKFSIDPSITEATLLVFRKPDAQPTQVIPPDGDTFGADNAPPHVTWHRDKGYDMLTIVNPQAGEWRIRAEVDPDNRVMVVTDLKMRTTDLPNKVIQGETFPFNVSFSDHGKTIEKPEFLNVVNVTAIVNDVAGASEPQPLLDDGQNGDQQANDGVFSTRFGGENLNSGVGEWVIDARGPTFMRERRAAFEVVPPVALTLTPWQEGQGLDLNLKADETLIDPASAKLEVWLEDESGVPVELEVDNQGSQLSGKIDLLGFSGSRKITVKATAQSLQGGPVEYLDSPAEVEGVKPPPPVAPEPPPVEPPAVEDPQPPPEPEPAQQPEPEAEDSWLSTAIWFSAINLIVLALAGGAFWWVRRSNQRNKIDLLGEHEDTATEVPAEQEESA